MKKTGLLLMIAALGAVALGGCDNGENPKNVDDEEEEELLPPPQLVDKEAKLRGCQDIEGHALVKEIEDGAEYYMGIYHTNGDDLDELRFINGEPHKDSKGSYPYYLGTDSEDDTSIEESAKVKIHKNGDTFKISIHKQGAEYDGQYIGVYMATSSYNKDVFSIHMDANGVSGKQTFDVTDARGTKTVSNTDVYYDFVWSTYNEDYELYTYSPTVMIKDTRAEENNATPKYLGTGANGDEYYISIDCKNEDSALGDETYSLTHFFEI